MANKIQIKAIFDYIIELNGDHNFAQNERLVLKNDNSVKALVISASENKAFCIVNVDPSELKIEDEFIISKESNLVKTSKKFFGKIIDIENNIVYPATTKETVEFMEYESNIFNKPNDLMSYKSLNKQLNTGYISVDLLVPIGKGQRELIIGDRKTGKTFIALNTIINQKNKNVKCIYAAIGTQHSQLSTVYKLLEENGALEQTIIVKADSDRPYDQYLLPYVAMAHAENLSYEDDVLIIFDDLTTHANIYREMALLTNKPVGKEAFPGDMFYAHSRLLERSGNFTNRKSITALPILQTVDNDITSLISSNIISITDGQIVTNSEIFASGKYPAVDIDLSVSRIGGMVQSKEIAKVASKIGKIYKAYRRQTKLSSLKYDLNEQTNNLIKNGLLIEEMFNQKGISLYSEEDLLLNSDLISWNCLTDVKDVQLALKFCQELIKVDENARKIFESTKNTKNIDPRVSEFFKSALKQFSNKLELNWNIKVQNEFIPIKKDILNNIIQKLGVNNGSENN